MKIKHLITLIGALATANVSQGEESKLVDSFKIGGDVRTRVLDYDHRFNNAPDLRVYDTRLRLNADTKVNNVVSLNGQGVFEMATTPNLDLRLADGNEAYINRAGAKVKLDCLEGDLGIIDNPFAKTIPQVDADYPIVGGSLRYNHNNRSFNIVCDAGRLIADETKTSMAGFQTVHNWNAGKMKGDFNLGYQHIIDFDNKQRFSNSKNAKFDVLSFGGGISFPTRIPLRLSGEYCHNFGMPEHNNAYMVGLKIGETKKPGDVSLFLGYRYIERDSLVAGLAIRDSPRTNINNPIGRLDLKVSEYIGLYLFSGNPEHIVPTSAKDDQRIRYLEGGAIFKF